MTGRCASSRRGWRDSPEPRERAPRAALRFDREIGAVAAATRHAIALGLISADEADAVWAAVAGRHPDAEWCRAGPRLAA